MTKLTPSLKRWLCLLFLLACIVPFKPQLNPQLRHLRQIDEYLKRVGPELAAFKNREPGFDAVKLTVMTSREGQIGVNTGPMMLEQLLIIKRFLEGTSPPRPLVFPDSPWRSMEQLAEMERQYFPR